jgi:hypothetical protein
MFRCDSCHTEYGGIRGLPSGTCPRCRKHQASLMRPVATTASFAGASPSPLLTAPLCSIPPMPLAGEIARRDRAVRF